MENQPPENTISPEVIQAAFALAYGPTIGQLTFQKLDLERQNQALLSRLAEVEAQMFAAEQDRARMIQGKIDAEVTTLIDRVQELEAELGEYRNFTKRKLSPESAKIAAEGDAILASVAKEKAAPD